MGHPTEIFSPEPSPSCICAICHDVLQDASSLKECGHTFCDACIKHCLEHNPSCPNCRVVVTGSNPNYSTRGMVEDLQVSCPGYDDENGRKRKRGCDWKGLLKDLNDHENECGFKMVTCSVDGCEHTCKRKDMEGHRSSATGMIMHMELRYENKMERMELRCKYIQLRCESLELKHATDLKAMEQQYESKLKKQAWEMELSIDSKVEACGKFWNTRLNSPSQWGPMMFRPQDPRGAEYEQFGYEHEGDVLNRMVLQYIESNSKNGSCVHMDDIIVDLASSGGVLPDDIHSAVECLSKRGQIHSDTSGNHYPVEARERRHSVNDAVIQCVKTLGVRSDSGVNVCDIMSQVMALRHHRFAAYEITSAINTLSHKGHIYSTIDEETFLYAE